MQSRPWHGHYDAGVPASVDFDELTVHGLFARAVQRHGNRTALVFLGKRLSYRQLGDQVDRLATALAARGVVPGSRVAIHMPNLPQTVISYLGVLTCGAQAVMTNPLYTAPEIVHQWNDAQVSLAITADFLYQRVLAGLRDELPVQHYIVASIPEYLGFPKRQLARLRLSRATPPMVQGVTEQEHVRLFRSLVDETSPSPPRLEVGLDDLACLQYTGGTTGVSKAAMLSHRNLSFNAQQVRAWMPELALGGEVVLAALPYFHIFGLTVCLGLPLCIGATIVLVPNPRDVRAMVDMLEKQRVTMLPAVPVTLDKIAALPGIERRDLSSIKAVFSGSAPLSADTLRRFEGLTGAVIFEGYGLTETSPLTHCNPVSGERRVGTVGMPVCDTDARIVDAEDATRELPVGATGELLVSGPQVMQGYWKRPDETAGCLTDGWLATGDLATMDEQGYFRIVGRKKDMILCSGYNVYPDEVDRVLMDHPAVAEACTIGVPDETRGELVKSFVVLVPGGTADAAELNAHCRERLAAYKVPREFEFRSELPKSAMLKLLRRELRDEELARRRTAASG